MDGPRTLGRTGIYINIKHYIPGDGSRPLKTYYIHTHCKEKRTGVLDKIYEIYMIYISKAKAPGAVAVSGCSGRVPFGVSASLLSHICPPLLWHVP